MSLKVTDIDFSFEKQAEERERLEIQQDHRRRRITSEADTGKPRKPSWKQVPGATPPPVWTVERPAGKPATFRENVEDLTGFRFVDGSAISRSVFELKVIEPCCIGGQSAEPGDLVTCYAATGHELVAMGRCKVVVERTPDA